MDKEHIVELYENFNEDFSKLRNRAILMLGKDSGLRVSDMAALDAHQFWEAETRQVPDIGEFRIFKPMTTQKTGDTAHPIIGPEAVDALKDYLGERREGPLFLTREGKRILSTDLTGIFMMVKIRKKLLKHDYTKISAHSLRKFHYTMLPFREDWILWLEGKSTSVYVDNPSEVTQAYIDNYSKIRVFESDVVQNTKRDKEIELLNAKLKLKDDEIASLKNSQKKLEEDMKKESEKMNDRFDTAMKQLSEEVATRANMAGMTYDIVSMMKSDPDTYHFLLKKQPEKLSKYKLKADKS